MNDNPKGQSFSSLPRPQKTAVIILSVAAVGILAVWFWQFNTRINSPFRPSRAEMAQGEKDAQAKIEKENADRFKDSDSDGLIDSDETNIYQTSPYLEDTDGDGISDSQEIKLGKDPLCAEGTDCSFGTNNASSTITQSSSTPENDPSVPAENVDQELLIKALNGQGDAETMRQILLQGGANPEQVKVLSDEDLMGMYVEVMKAQNPDVTIDSSSTN